MRRAQLEPNIDLLIHRSSSGYRYTNIISQVIKTQNRAEDRHEEEAYSL